MTKKEKEVNPLWGGRFTKGTGDLAQSFSASVDVDKNLFEVDIKGSIAYAEILKAAKILAKSLAVKIFAAFRVYSLCGDIKSRENFNRKRFG